MKTRFNLKSLGWAGMMIFALGIRTTFAEPFVYVPLGDEGKIAVVDAAKDEIIRTIGDVPAIHGLALTPNGELLIAGSFDIRKADGSAPEKPSSISMDEHTAHHSATSSKNKTVENIVSTVSVIRAIDGSVVRRIDVPGAVHHVMASPDGRYAVATLPNEGKISVIDLKSYVVATVMTGSLPNYAVFSPDAARVYVSNAGSNTISEIGTSNWTVLRTFSTGNGPEHMTVSRGGQALFVINGDDDTVSQIETKEGATVRSFNIDDALHGLDLSKNDNILFVSALGQDKMFAIDLRDGQIRDASLAPAPYHLTVLGNTDKIYVSSSELPKIWVVDQNTLKIIREIQIIGKGHQMVVAPAS